MYALNRGTRVHPLAEVDRMFADLFGRPAPEGAVNGTEFAPSLDISETEAAYDIRAELPGVLAADVEVAVVEDVLTIRGEKKSDEDAKDRRVHRAERRYGKFARSVQFPSAVDADKVTASHKHGVLTIHVPKAAKALPRTVKIEFAD